MRFLFIIVLATILYSFASEAHPVSFQGATSLMSFNREKENELVLHYSFKNWFSLGANLYKYDQTEYSFARANFLVKRWNNEDSQGNVYLGVGQGLEKSFNENKNATLLNTEADWESRRYYVSAAYSKFFRENSGSLVRPDFEHSKLRLGAAPYLADFNDLNTWFIVQFDKMNDREIETTQFVRLFYKNVLLELGATYGGGWAFNYMVHF